MLDSDGGQTKEATGEPVAVLRTMVDGIYAEAVEEDNSATLNVHVVGIAMWTIFALSVVEVLSPTMKLFG